MSHAPRGSTPLPWLTLLASLAIGALVWLVFRPALDAQFLFFDDDQVITGNRAFRGLGAEHLAWMFRASHLGHYQPATWLSYALDHALFGLDARAFHRTNVVLHGLGAIAFFGFARVLLARALAAGGPDRPGGPGLERLLTGAATAAALLFAVHPLRAESVAWATERRDVLSGLFLLLGLGAWMRWVPAGGDGAPAEGSSRARLGACVAGLLGLLLWFSSVELERGALLGFSGLGLAGIGLAVSCLVVCAALALRGSGRAGTALWYWLALLCFLLSLFAKAWGIVVPALLLVLDVWPLRRLAGGRWPRPRELGALVVEKLPFLCLAVVFAALAAWAQATQIDTMKGLDDHTLAERVAQAAYGLAWYPWKTLVPGGLVAIYELPEVLSLGDPRFLAPLIGVVGLTAVLWLARRRAPALLTAWVAFVVVVSPVLGFLQSGPQLVADRYSYLSCLPFALLAGGALLVARPRAPVALVLAAAIGVYGFLGHRQAAVWHDSRTLWEHALAERPASPMAMIMLAGDHQRRAAQEPAPAARREQLDRARALLEQARTLDLDPHIPSGLSTVHLSLALLDPALADEHNARAVELAREALELAHQTSSFTPHYRLIYGTALWNAGRSEQALEHFLWFARAQPDHVQGLVAAGRALAALGRPAEAQGPLERALQLEPGQADVWRELAGVYEALGNPAQARAARGRAAALGG